MAASTSRRPRGFRIPNANIDGRVAVFTLEGDPANSTTQDGFDEALRFNGNLLNDGINVAGSDPLIQQYDGTINTQGVANSYGIDVDQYDVSAFLAPGQTTATLTYSAGADLVLLMTQIVSATSDPIVDLSVTRRTPARSSSGGTGQYTITVSNSAGAGIEREDNIVTVRDTLPAGLTYNSASGTGWTCGAVGPARHLHACADAESRRVLPAAHDHRERARGGRGVGGQHRRRQHDRVMS